MDAREVDVLLILHLDGSHCQEQSGHLYEMLGRGAEPVGSDKKSTCSCVG